LETRLSTQVKDLTFALDFALIKTDKEMGDMGTGFEKIKPTIVEFSGLRTAIFSLMFAFPLLPIVLTFATVLTKKTIFLTIQNGLTWLAFSLILIVLGLHLIITVILSDICMMNDVIFEKGITHFDMEGGAVIQACFDYDIRAIDVFGVTEVYSFADRLNFTFVHHANDSFNLEKLDELKASVASTTKSTFDGRMDTVLQECNDLIATADVTTPLVTRANLASQSASSYYTAGKTAKISTLQTCFTKGITTLGYETAAKASQFDDSLTAMKADIDAIKLYTDDLKEEVRDWQALFAAAEPKLDIIMEASTQLMDPTNTCGFIGKDYKKLDESMCLKLAPSIAAMCLSMLLVVIFLFPVCCIGIYLKGNLQKREDRIKVVAAKEGEIAPETTGEANL